MHPVPEGYSDEQAVLVEPIACAVHSALRADVSPNARVLVSGAGSVGLLTTLALRQLTPAGEIIVVAKHGHQRELPLELRRHRGGHARGGAAPGTPARAAPSSSSPSTPAATCSAAWTSPFDAVGSKQSLETALHATRAGGRVVLSGMPAAADLSAAWFRELEVVGTYASARAEPSRRRPQLLRRRHSSWPATTPSPRLAKTVAPYPLHRWREALDHAQSAGRLGTVKVAFDPRKRG